MVLSMLEERLIVVQISLRGHFARSYAEMDITDIGLVQDSPVYGERIINEFRRWAVLTRVAVNVLSANLRPVTVRNLMNSLGTEARHTFADVILNFHQFLQENALLENDQALVPTADMSSLLELIRQQMIQRH